ncbi:MAG: hypothetical protein JNM94_04185 [Phycisphaerae bacterium]|nr:hypothetical protein [Phycisphaerae bacterium]
MRRGEKDTLWHSTRIGATLVVAAMAVAFASGCATSSSAAKKPVSTPRATVMQPIVLPTPALSSAERARGLPASGSPDLPEFSRNDGRLGSAPPELVTANVAWRYTYDQQRIDSGRPNATYRQTYRSFERVQR